MTKSSFIGSTLDEAELSDLRDQFDAIDVDKNGVISFEEMRQAMEKDLPWRMISLRVCSSRLIEATAIEKSITSNPGEEWRGRQELFAVLCF